MFNAMTDSGRQLSVVLRFSLLAAIVGVFAGCAGSGMSSGNPDMLTSEQIEEAGTAINAYVLVQRLRPNWLRTRGRSSVQNPGELIVYVDGSRRGGASALRQINVVNVESMQFMNANQATLRYGSGHDHGVIEVRLKEN